MEYQIIINLLENMPNQPSKFRTKKMAEINDNAPETHNKNSQFKFKNSRLKSSLCDYNDVYILASGTIATYGAGADDNVKRLDERNKVVVFKTCAPFTNCIREIKNTQIDNANDLDVVMLIYN